MKIAMTMFGAMCVSGLALGFALKTPAEASPTAPQPFVTAGFAETETRDADQRERTIDRLMIEVGAAPAAPAEIAQQSANPSPRQHQPDAEFLLAATMWGEARSEGKRGMAWVGHVVVNRAAAGFRGSTVSEVVTYRRQFSCWNRLDPNRAKLTRAYLDATTGVEAERWAQAKELAHGILAGSRDYTGGSTSYHTTAIDPAWSGDYRVTATIGRHVFYR